MRKIPSELAELLKKKRVRKHNKSFYISDEVYNDFMELCKKQDTPASQIVEKLLIYYLSLHK